MVPFIKSCPWPATVRRIDKPPFDYQGVIQTDLGPIRLSLHACGNPPASGRGCLWIHYGWHEATRTVLMHEKTKW